MIIALADNIILASIIGAFVAVVLILVMRSPSLPLRIFGDLIRVVLFQNLETDQMLVICTNSEWQVFPRLRNQLLVSLLVIGDVDVVVIVFVREVIVDDEEKGIVTAGKLQCCVNQSDSQRIR